MPVRGFRCEVCGDETILAGDVGAAEETADRLGLFGIQNSRKRKLLRTGNSIAVSLDPELVRDVLKGLKPGEEVRVGRQGGRIVIEPA